ncbi:SulP family inorganic anion transporter [Taibaiella chishuiensis]|uniref:MFS superfamily sulfate permease-like transporter n=1 Tax=Taibaiella chishuiensis TaxID=1434707 RepID=A0A2P8DCX9_9BACT|nr:SulP family inorganic anion transporter [Taibaiella chishuiensis]PSK95081.1 MFS superfamily sulfate permease-like transporter [Taibaiella chishuiensis]
MSKEKSFFANAKSDLTAGLIVFLIALPLCLGIAQASNAPPLAGIIAGVIGGIVIGFFSKSQLSVSGPAAGLVAIVIGALEKLGAFEIFLCAVILAGAFQLLLGFLRAGSIANYFPTNVIEGMLAGIGLTIIIKQIPDAVGFVNPKHTEGMTDADDGFTLQSITDSFNHLEPGAIIIAMVGIGILVLWSLKGMKKVQMIPAGLLVVIIGTLLNQLFATVAPSLYVSGNHLVNLPVPKTAGDFFGNFKLPDLSGFANPMVWSTGLVIAVVASIETLLCIEATDKLDPQKRYTSGDAELRAQGIGNIVSGFIGGLPITSVIVRSSANINAGARTKLSTIFHGSLLLVCVATIPFILNLIPKAGLAAILIYTGYRLCRPAVFKHMWHAGLTQFLPFVITALAVVFLDLLKGVGLGMAFSIFYILRNNLRIPFFYKRSVYESGEVVRLELAQEVSFLNKASIKKTLENIPEGSTLILDATNTEYIDYDVLELIKEFQLSKAPDKDIRMSLIGFRNTYHLDIGSADHKEEEELPGYGQKPIRKTAGDYKKLLKQLTS